MPDKAKPSRKVSEIQNEYQGLCIKTGHIQYQIDALSKELAVLNETMRDLNFEAAASQQAENEAKAEAAKEASEVKVEEGK